jgi:hypothetical protein
MFCKNQAGSVSLPFGIALPVLALAGGVAIDYIKLSSKKSALQQLADESSCGREGTSPGQQRQFSLSAGPTMVLNTNYSATDIPVPDGVGR